MANRPAYPWHDDPGTRTNARSTAQLVQKALDHEAAATLERLKAYAAVKEARDLGATWQSIADAMGTSRQAVQQRYGRNPTG